MKSKKDSIKAILFAQILGVGIMSNFKQKFESLFSYVTEDKNDENVKKRKSKAATNICAIISILLLFYLLTGLSF
ncbi:hypothetical protein ACH36K_08080 [Clostridium sp. MB05]|jgi:hypothetical protein|uniref:hypothetical protein n=1 Tax=Clostridium sp. MB05 TaxID=3376682 RepID=UPI003981AAF1